MKMVNLNFELKSFLNNASKKTLGIGIVGAILLIPFLIKILGGINLRAEFFQNDESGIAQVTFAVDPNGLFSSTNTTIIGNQMVLSGSTGQITSATIKPASFTGWGTIFFKGTTAQNGTFVFNITGSTDAGCNAAPIPSFQNIPLSSFTINGNGDYELNIAAINYITFPCLRIQVLMTSTGTAIEKLGATRTPYSQTALGITSPTTVQAGNAINVIVGYSVNFVGNSDLVVYVPFPSTGNNSIYNFNLAYNQNNNLSFNNASNGGIFTTSAIVVSGVSVPARSVYRYLGNQSKGSSANLSFNATVPIGTQSGTTYLFTGYAKGLYSSLNSSNTTTTRVSSTPSVSINKTAPNAIKVGQNDYFLGSVNTSINYSININTVGATETLFNTTITDSLSNIYNTLTTKCGVTTPSSRILSISNGGILGTNTISRTLGNLIPNTVTGVTFTVDYSGCPTTGFSSVNAANVDSDFTNPITGSHLLLGINQTGGFVGTVNKTPDAAFPPIEHFYGDTDYFTLSITNNGIFRQDHAIIFDKIDTGKIELLGATAQGILTGVDFQIYFNTGGSSNLRNNPPSFSYINGLSTFGGTWFTGAVQPDTTWVAVYVRCLTSPIFTGTAGGNTCYQKASAVMANLFYRVKTPAGPAQCDDDTLVNTGHFRIYSGSSNILNRDVDITFKTNYIQDDTAVIKLKGTKGNLETTNNSFISPGTIYATQSGQFFLKLKNNGNAAIQSGEVTFQIPQIAVNGTMQYPTISSVQGGTYTYNTTNGKLLVQFGPISPNATLFVRFNIDVPAGIINNTSYPITALATGYDLNCGPIVKNYATSFTVLGTISLGLQKEAKQSVIQSFGFVDYIMTATNSGTATSQKTFIVDIIPPTAQFVSATTSGFDINANQYYCTGCIVYFASGNLTFPQYPLSTTNPFTLGQFQQFATGTVSATGLRTSPYGANTKYVAYLIDNMSAPQTAQGFGVGTTKVGLKIKDLTTAPNNFITNNAGIINSELPQALTTPVQTQISPQPGLYLSITSSKPSIYSCEPFDLLVNYRNNGSQLNTFTTLTITLPAALDYMSGYHIRNPDTPLTPNIANGDPFANITSSPHLTSGGNTIVTFNVTNFRPGDLQPLEGGRLKLRVQEDCTTAQGGTLNVSAQGNYGNTNITPSPKNASTSIIVVNPDLSIKKTATPAIATIGTTVTYTLKIQNLTTTDALNATLADVLGTGLCYVPSSAQIVGPAGRTLGPTTVQGTCPNTQTLIRTGLKKSGYATGTIPGNTIGSNSLFISYQATIDPSATYGTTLYNTAIITGSTPETTGGNNTDTTGVLIPLPDPTVAVYHISPPPQATTGVVTPGGNFAYKVNYRNTQPTCSTGTYVIQSVSDIISPTSTADFLLTSVVPQGTAGTIYYNTANNSFDPLNPTSNGWSTTLPATPASRLFVAIFEGELCQSEGQKTVTFVGYAKDISNNDLAAGSILQHSASVYLSGADQDTTNNTGNAFTVVVGLDLAIDVQGIPEGPFPGITPGSNRPINVTFSSPGVAKSCRTYIDLQLDPQIYAINPTASLSPVTLSIHELGNANNPIQWLNNANNTIGSSTIGELTSLGGGVYRVVFGGNANSGDVCLPPQAEGTFQIFTQISGTVADSSSVALTGTIGQNGQVETFLGNNTDMTFVSIYRADVITSKTGATYGGNPTDAKVGEFIKYTVKYNNVGNRDASDATIIETLPVGVCFKVGSIFVPGAIIEYNTSYTGSNRSYSPVADGFGTDCSVKRIKISFLQPLPVGGRSTGELHNFAGTMFQIGSNAGYLELLQTTKDRLLKGSKIAPGLSGYYFGTGSEYLYNGSFVSCNLATMTTTVLSPGTYTTGTFYGSGKIIILNEGDYFITGTIQLAECSVLAGSGNVTIHASQYFNGPMLSLSAGDSSSNRSIIENIRLDGSSTGFGWAHTPLQTGIAINTSPNVVHNVQVYNFTGGVQFNQANFLVNSQIYNNLYNVIFTNDSSIMNNNLIYNGGYGLTLTDGIQYLGINNNQFFNHSDNGKGYGIGFLGGTVNVLINNNEIYNNEYGIYNSGDLIGGLNLARLNNVGIYNNVTGVFLGSDNDGFTYYGELILFGNGTGIVRNNAGTYFSGGLANDTDITPLGRANGFETTTATMSCSEATVPYVGFNGGSCDTIGQITGFNGPIDRHNYIFGTNINKNIQTVFSPAFPTTANSSTPRYATIFNGQTRETGYYDSGTYTIPVRSTGVLQSRKNLIAEQIKPTNTQVTYELFSGSSCTGALQFGPAANTFPYFDISSIPSSIPNLCLKVTLLTTNDLVTPKLGSRQISYQTTQDPYFTFDVRVPTGSVVDDPIHNVVDIFTSTPEITDVNNHGEYDMNLVNTDLQVVKSGTPVIVSSGDIINFIFTYFNNGPEPAENVLIHDVFPTGFVSILSSSPSTPGLLGGGRSIGTLPVGSGGTVSITGIVTGGIINPPYTLFPNTVGIFTTTYETTLSNNTSTVITQVGQLPNPRVDIVCSTLRACNQQISCTLTYGNNGNTAATGVNLTGLRSTSQVTFVSATGATTGCTFGSSTFSCAGTSFNNLTLNQTYTINLLFNVASSGAGTATVSSTISTIPAVTQAISSDNTSSFNNSVCPGTCGDSIVQSPEQCDDGPSGSSTCTNTCQTVVTPPPPPPSGGGCNGSCGGSAPSCGNGFLNAGEECDYGIPNSVSGLTGGRYCSLECKIVGPSGTGGSNLITPVGIGCKYGDEPYYLKGPFPDMLQHRGFGYTEVMRLNCLHRGRRGIWIYYPDSEITIAEVIKTVVKVWGLNNGYTVQKEETFFAGDIPFKDVGAYHRAAQYLPPALRLGLLDGITRTIRNLSYIDPDRFATRNEVIKLVMKTYRLLHGNHTTQTSTQFLDVPSNDPYRQYILAAEQLGIIQGVLTEGGKYFQGNRYILRAEFAKMTSIAFKSELAIDVNLTIANSKLYKLIIQKLKGLDTQGKNDLINQIIGLLQQVDPQLFFQNYQVNKDEFIDTLKYLLTIKI